MVRGRLWRMSDPALDEGTRERWVAELMRARRDVAKAKREADEALMRDARARVDAAKIALGERGEPWWTDGAKDWNRFLARNTPYRAWAEAQETRE